MSIAKQLLADTLSRFEKDERSWFQCAWAGRRFIVEREDGSKVEAFEETEYFTSEDATCWCLVGMVRNLAVRNFGVNEFAVAENKDYQEAIGMLYAAAYPERSVKHPHDQEDAVINWNDKKERTIKDVIELVRKAQT